PPPPPPPPPAEIIVDYEWTFDGAAYYLTLNVWEEDYQAARHTTRIPHDSYYGELVSYALGPGYAEAAAVADGLYELALDDRLGYELLPFAVRFIQQAAPGADFEIALPFHYPMESLIDGGRNSGDQAALGAAVLENLGYATGIAIFWNTWGSSVHAALAISDADWEPHDYDDLGTGWTFLEPTACGDYRRIGSRPSWFCEFDAWVVWPLWEATQSVPIPRKGGKAQAGAQIASPGS
ncbi:MAG: hypothetical protein V1784_03455, partial [bacterium]